ncbi:hypothetical protein CEXT_553671 [Caerostris extrusa]|uniref:Uncharacterized protein n=1 Tax=Caerostris extrusa TaxID=172846 RepID=A0AAV4PZ57_CAEEX|nr:hypothetical protein CEXT_553671 [Caerostris extrusa]
MINDHHFAPNPLTTIPYPHSFPIMHKYLLFLALQRSRSFPLSVFHHSRRKICSTLSVRRHDNGKYNEAEMDNHSIGWTKEGSCSLFVPHKYLCSPSCSRENQSCFPVSVFNDDESLVIVLIRVIGENTTLELC